MRIPLIVAIAAAVLIGACSEHEGEQARTAPAPVEITREAVGHYCNMIVADHVGPKGQVHIEGREGPVWFSSVRDAIVFTLLPEEPKNIAAIYVNDMGRASWDRPESGTWIDAREAWYVIGSDKVGGMGAPEVVPFGQESDAESFAARHGGRIVALGDVPEDYVLSDASESQHGGMHPSAGGGQHASAASSPDSAGAASMGHAHEHSDTGALK
jgi:copper chaperone NosL